MQGIEAAVDALVDRLAARLDAKTGEIRGRLGIDPDTEGHLCPDVVTVKPYDDAQMPAGEWPAVLVSGLETLDLRVAEVDADETRWAARYRCRVFVWVRGDSETDVVTARSRIVLAVREVLLTDLDLADVLDDDSDLDARVDPYAIRESFSDVASAKSLGTIGGAYVELTVLTEETLTQGAPFGTAETITLDTRSVPPAAPLP